MLKTVQLEQADYMVLVLTEKEVETLQFILGFHQDSPWPEGEYYSTEALDSLMDKVK